MVTRLPKSKKTDLGKLQGIDAKKLNSKNFWLAFEKIVSEKKVKENKEKRGLRSNEKVDINELEKVLDDKKIEAIEMGIWENLFNKLGAILDLVLYDTTNFYTFHQDSTPNMVAQYSKNKENQPATFSATEYREPLSPIESQSDKVCPRSLPKRWRGRQVGLQLAIIKDLGIPVFHNVYAGHQNDVCLLPTAIRTLLRRYMESTL